MSITRKAIEEDRAHVLICCTTTPVSLAIIDTVTAAKVTNISMGAATSVASPASTRPFTYKTPISEVFHVQWRFPKEENQRSCSASGYIANASREIQRSR